MIQVEKLLLNADEASYALGISKSTLFRLTQAKQLTKVNISERRVAWPKSELHKFILKHTKTRE